MAEAKEHLYEDPPFDLKNILKKEVLSPDDFTDFSSRTDNPSIVLADLLNAGKEYGKAKKIDDTGPQYATMKLLSMLTTYKSTLSPTDSALCDLQVRELLDIIYQEIKTNNRDHIDYRDQRVKFFNTSYFPVFQKNVEIGKDNLKLKEIEKNLNEQMRQNFIDLLPYFQYDLTFFENKDNVKKILNKSTLEVYGDRIGHLVYTWENNNINYIQRKEGWIWTWKLWQGFTNEKFATIHTITIQGKQYFFPMTKKWPLPREKINEFLVVLIEEATQKQTLIWNKEIADINQTREAQFIHYFEQIKNFWAPSITVYGNKWFPEIIAAESKIKIIESFSVSVYEYNWVIYRIDPLFGYFVRV